MAEKKKVTLMLLKVDLECSKCYKKVKKILCKFPQIQDQAYDEKNNTVMIKVVCCSPEKIRDKICCKGRGTIKSIEILKPPEKPKPAEKPKADPPKPAEKPKADPPKPAEKPKADPPKPADKPKADPPKPADKPKADPPKEKPADKPTKVVTFVDEPKPPAPAPSPAPGPVQVGFCCTECSEGRGGGPCYGQPVRYYDGYCGRPVYDSWGGGGYRGNYGSRCSEYYFNEDNSQGCTIM
ncbi:hypothetical protein Ddye_012564 [Dipteronia dyeriana]|uniref:HMA domain-containing protein n=1 Tax=Dipteronia dyeriana TaxID=168575 RepID=A0AAE0CJD1_9ROSI|nr:hypothetical protein Ddye_012564 [Dipteronia dyeriana]